MTTLPPVRKASPQVVRVVDRTHSHRLAAFCTEPTVAQKPELPGTAIGIELLYTREIATQNRQRSVEDLLVKRLCAARRYQLRGDLLEPLGGRKLPRKHFLTLFQRPIGFLKLAGSIFLASSAHKSLLWVPNAPR